MKIKVEVKDTLTEYLETLENNVEEHFPDALKKAALLLVGTDEGDDGAYIPSNMSTDFNPNLWLSGQEEDRWVIENDNGEITLFINYTGMTWGTSGRYTGEGDMMGWWEFGGESQGYPQPPTRDYAYFQETGKDKLMDKFHKNEGSKYAHHKHGIKKGLKEGTRPVRQDLARYLELLLELE